ncbi:hypothetical protein BH11BAC5_BH11BAC5_08720 [soil metagenome]
MTKNQHNRRNFLSCIAILSAGTAMGSTVNTFITANKKEEAPDKNWERFWKKTGGRIFNGKIELEKQPFVNNTSGHHYQNGQAIFFAKENLLAQPTWIYWGDDRTTPKDVVITLFENSETQKKITRLNRFEIDAVYRLSKEHAADQLLLTHHNASKPLAGNISTFIQNKTLINRHSNTQHLSYFKEQSLVFHKKIIYNV